MKAWRSRGRIAGTSGAADEIRSEAGTSCVSKPDPSSSSRSSCQGGSRLGLGKVQGRLIKLFITGDDPRSLRTVELDNWWGMAVMGRPSYFKKALEREELTRSCVYLLIQSGSSDDLPEVYVGESDEFAQRYVTAKFPISFDTFIVFTNKDDNLTRAHVKWLELRLWELLSDNQGKVTLANKSKPTGSRLPEAETATMFTFLENMIYILEALGYEFFSAAERQAEFCI